MGVLIKKNLNINITKKYYDPIGRLLVLDAVIGGVSFRLISVYAPNGELERKKFIQSLDKFLVGNTNVLLGGISTSLRIYY